MPDQQVAQSETLEEIAHGIVAMFYEGARYPSRFAAYSHVLSCLRNERERCAKVIDNEVESLRSLKYPTSYAKWKIEELPRIARAIREGR